MDDKHADGTDNEGERNPMSKLTEVDIKSIRGSLGTCESVAQAYGISSGHVSNIRSRKAWAHVA